jgi:uncharacterized protein YoxC
VSAGEIAALIAAAAFVLLVGLLAVPILKLGRTLDEATLAIRKTHEGAAPILADAQTTVTLLNTELSKVEGITENAQSVSSNAAALSSLFTSTVSGPVVKVAAFSYGIRRAASNRRKAQVEREVKSAARSRGRDRGRHSRKDGE